MHVAPIAQPGRVMPAGRRTSLMQQISLADVNPAAAAQRRATLAQVKEDPAKRKPRGQLDAASLAELIAHHETKVVPFEEEDTSEASAEDEENSLFMPEDMRCLALLAEVRRMAQSDDDARAARPRACILTDVTCGPPALPGRSR